MTTLVRIALAFAMLSLAACGGRGMDEGAEIEIPLGSKAPASDRAQQE